MPVSRTTRDGIVVGFIAYAMLAAFYAAFDVLAARGMFYTVNMLGQAMFRGVRDPAVLQFPIDLDGQAIMAYNAFHLAAAVAIGLLATALVDLARRQPARAPALLIAIAAGIAVAVWAVGSLSSALRPVLPWWSIIVANALATFGAALYLQRRRPGLWRGFIPERPRPRAV